MTIQTANRVRLLLVAAALLAAGPGCGPLVGVRATIRVEEHTRLEREVLGTWGQVSPQTVLLSLAPQPRTEVAALPTALTELQSLYDEFVSLEARLANLPGANAEARTWQVVAVHNQAVLKARLGDRAAAADLLNRALRTARAYGLPSMEWQALVTLHDLDEKAAADRLQAGFDRDLESPAFRARLYAALVSSSLAAGQPEEELRYATERAAVEMQRSIAPGKLAVPESKLGTAVRGYEAARAEAARTRDLLCRLPLEQAEQKDAPARVAFEQALRAFREAGESLRSGSPLGALLVPEAGDALAVRELLTAGTALLAFEPAGEDAYAAFVLGPDVFRAERVQLPATAAAGASVDKALEGDPAGQALEAAAAALLRPFEAELGQEGLERLYLVVPPALSGLAWQSMPFQGKPLAERFQVAFLTSLSDLTWAFSNKRYGRQSLLLCGVRPMEEDSMARGFAGDRSASFFNAAQRGKEELTGAIGPADLLWFGMPLRIQPAAPEGTYLALPGELGLLSGISLGELSAWRVRAACAGFAASSLGSYDEQSFGALQAFLRAMMAAGAPSVALGVAGDRVPEQVRGAYWQAFLKGLRQVPAAESHRRALAAVEPRWREAFRLYGFAGMNAEEFAQFSKLEFNELLAKARADLEAGHPEDAVSRFLELWHMAEALTLATESQKAVVLANIQQYIVRCWQELRQYDSAATHQGLRMDYLASSGQVPGTVMAVEYQSLGALLTQAERFDDAAAAYARSIELLREHGGEEELARALGELGKSLDRATEYDRALETFQEALDRYRQLQQEAGVALQHGRMGAIWLKRLNDAPRAEEHLREAMKLYRAAAKDQAAVAATVDVGLCRRAVGDFPGALELFQQALQEAERLGLRATAARALSEIGNTRWLRGEYQAAFELVAGSNQIARQLDLPFQLNVNYQLLGLIYWELNDYENAHRALQTAIEAARRAEEPLEVASGYNNQGIVYRRQEKYQDALDSFGRALEIDTRLRTRWGQGYDHRNIGITLHRMGRYDEASPHLEKAVAISGEIQDRVNLAKAQLALGELRLDQKRFDEANALLQEALKGAREVYLPEVEWRALRALGRLLRAQGDREGALQAFKAGVDVVERMGGAIKVEEFRSGFLTNKMDLYEDTVRLLLDMGRSDEAFEYSERSRARRFMDVLAGQAFDLKTDRERELYGRLQELSGLMRALHDSLANEKDADARAQLAARLSELERQYSDTLVDIRAANPALSGFVTVEAVRAAEVPQFLPKDVTLAVYYVMQDELAIWVWRDGAMQVRRVPVKRDELAGRIRDFRIMVQNRQLLDDVRQSSRQLYDTIIGPVSDLLSGSRLVGIVPHGALHYLSFASLHDGQAFMVERYPLFYAPSVSVLRQTLTGQPPASKEGMKVLAMGNPAVGNPAYELPFTEREVESIQRDFTNATPVTGQAATEDWLRQNIGQFDVVHIGAHGSFDAVNPLFSSLFLAPAHEDGLLQLHEVTGLTMKAQLATLSACQSGLGRLESGDELVSLSRAFTYAGARSILSTLWRVDDVSTALVIKHFYRYYVDHGTAESLRHAQLQVMNDGRHYHPSYWAGVVLTGDFR
jgi:CHAT domain-containing protein